MNHYIRLDGDKIIKGFSDTFEQPEATDVLIAENADRHFMLFDQINPALTNEQGIPIYKYTNNIVIQRTEIEIQQDIDAIPGPDPIINNITLSKNKETIVANGTDVVTITATFAGEQVDTFTCYVTVNGPPAEAVPIINGQITREFTSQTIGLFKVEFYAGAAYMATFIEVTEVTGS